MQDRQYNQKTIPVFVYGTLKIGESNHHLIEGDSEYVDTVTLYGFTMVDLGAFPAVVEGGHSVTGQLMMVDQEAFLRMDHLEGHPDFYHRIWVDERPSPNLETNGFWIYIMDREDVADGYLEKDELSNENINRVIDQLTIRDGKW